MFAYLGLSFVEYISNAFIFYLPLQVSSHWIFLPPMTVAMFFCTSNITIILHSQAQHYFSKLVSENSHVSVSEPLYSPSLNTFSTLSFFICFYSFDILATYESANILLYWHHHKVTGELYLMFTNTVI